MSCICLDSEGQATFSSATHGEMRVHYPSGYKGWKFYNPTTQKYLISEHAEFDERIFPGLAKYKAISPADLTHPGSRSLAPVPTSVPMLDLEGDSELPKTR